MHDELMNHPVYETELRWWPIKCCNIADQLMSKTFVRLYVLCGIAHAPKDVKEGCTRLPHNN